MRTSLVSTATKVYTIKKLKISSLKTQQGVCVSVCVPMFICNSSREEVVNLNGVRVDAEGAGVWRGRVKMAGMLYPHMKFSKKKKKFSNKNYKQNPNSICTSVYLIK